MCSSWPPTTASPTAKCQSSSSALASGAKYQGFTSELRWSVMMVLPGAQKQTFAIADPLAALTIRAAPNARTWAEAASDRQVEFVEPPELAGRHLHDFAPRCDQLKQLAGLRRDPAVCDQGRVLQHSVGETNGLEGVDDEVEIVVRKPSCHQDAAGVRAVGAEARVVA